ncbi:sulfotransferase domain-containing protein [Roseicyclus mahoneyensis]|uniref:Sulfotransferase domain-containing protein n=1 Tax=Roseicyclus mahoneyensis TaxID=164332 RepID=A0A316GGU5_9RHOB|nr:sulfotransferase domain-containing protein [Roseicyclus mahoneyensis]PWK60106.1 hypothetical protein C7455_10589 [Roseicyclus mahoneyensis]
MTRDVPKRIDFFIVGAQKAATTALLQILSRHPRLCCSSPKELHVFDDDSRDWCMPAAIDLSMHFPNCPPDLLWGEATPIYMYWPHSIERLAAYNPGARIIVGLRHPAWRALSHWKMEVIRSRDDMSFSDAIRSLGRARVNPVHRVYSYVERGFYAPQIKRILAHFPRDQVFFYTTEDLFVNESAVVKDLLSFLRVTPDLSLAGESFVVPVDTTGLEIDARDEIIYLSALFAGDIQETMDLTDLDLRSWLDPDYAEGYFHRSLH